MIVPSNVSPLARFAPLAFVALLVQPACMTTGNNAHQNQTLNDLGQEKVGDKQPVSASDTTAGTQNPETPPADAIPTPEAKVPSIDEQLAFVKTHTSPNSNFGEAEHQFAQALPSNPPPGSITEAAVVIGVLRTVLNPRNLDAATFKEADIADGSQAEAVTVKTLSLENIAKERGVNLADALTENPLLGGYGVAKQVLAALNTGAGSPEFKTEITLALKRQSGLWFELSTAMTEADKPAPPPEDDSAAAPNPADLHGGDSVLSEAQALADRGNFLGAIKKASTIGPASPMRPMADEKIKEFSKTAVQELRTKAAAAFQTAAPVTDAKTKVTYLKQAKTFLEDAIKNFPQAPQLPTVRDNLRAISRDLEKLETEQGH